MFCWFSDSESDDDQNPELNIDNREHKLLPINIDVDNLANINVEDDGLSSQNESDDSQDRFSYKEFDSGGNIIKNNKINTIKDFYFFMFYVIYILYNVFYLNKYLFCFVFCVEDDESDTATEGEEEIKAREKRKQEVCLRIPDISAATSDTGSDTEVILFAQNSIKSINKQDTCLRNDGLPLNMTNMNICSTENSFNALNTSNCQPNGILIDFNNPNTPKNNDNFNSNNPSLSLENNSNVSLNNCLMNKHKSNNSFDVTFKSNNNCDHENQLLFIKEGTHKLKNGSLNRKQKKLLNQSREKSDDHSSIIEYNLVKDNGNQQSNNAVNDFKSLDKCSSNKCDRKPDKLNNIVTTEPYPKYTPTVEKAIKKYENKQPKKDCIVM